MQARCLLFEFQRRRYRAEDPSVGRNDFFNRLLGATLRYRGNEHPWSRILLGFSLASIQKTRRKDDKNRKKTMGARGFPVMGYGLSESKRVGFSVTSLRFAAL